MKTCWRKYSTNNKNVICMASFNPPTRRCWS